MTTITQISSHHALVTSSSSLTLKPCNRCPLPWWTLPTLNTIRLPAISKVRSLLTQRYILPRPMSSLSTCRTIMVMLGRCMKYLSLEMSDYLNPERKFNVQLKSLLLTAPRTSQFARLTCFSDRDELNENFFILSPPNGHRDCSGALLKSGESILPSCVFSGWHVTAISVWLPQKLFLIITMGTLFF